MITHVMYFGFYIPMLTHGLPVSNKTLSLDWFCKSKSRTFTNAVCGKTLAWLFAKLLEEELLKLSNWDCCGFLLKVQIPLLCFPLQFLHLQSFRIHEFALGPILKETRHFIFFLEISFCADGFLTFKHLWDLWFDKPEKAHAFLLN